MDRTYTRRQQTAELARIDAQHSEATPSEGSRWRAVAVTALPWVALWLLVVIGPVSVSTGLMEGLGALIAGVMEFVTVAAHAPEGTV